MLDKTVDDPGNQNLYSLFESQASKTPDAIALIQDNCHLTYAELLRQSNKWFHVLRKECDLSNPIVAVCIGRSSEFIIAVLAILKLGCAFVPIDPNLPLKRVHFIINTIQPGLVITLEEHEDKFFEANSPIIFVNDVIQQNDVTFENHVSPIVPTLAYIIFSSGTTGIPKGITVEHDAICQRLLSLHEYHPLQTCDILLHHTSLSFDVSIEEVFWPLIGGSKIVITPDSIHDSIENMVMLIIQFQVTLIDFVPALLSIFLQEKQVTHIRTLRSVFVGGDVLTPTLVEAFFQNFDIPLYNFYGPTEAIISATVYKISGSESGNPVPIGKSLSGTKIYILDQDLNTLPIGESGDIFIGGKSLAKGYLNDPQLTSQKFIQDPFSPDISYRMYKTGDIGYYDKNGDIVFQGRNDRQIKLRGFRIELEEIEAVLHTHELINKAVVVGIEKVQEKILIAFIQLKEKKDSRNDNLSDAIRSFLSTVLPSYMIPNQCFFIEKIPHLFNGKTDFNALYALYETFDSQLNDEMLFIGYEKKIADIWQKYLPVSSVSRYDDFFDLGGHSLIATQVIADVNSLFHINCPLRGVFDYPILHEFSNFVHEQIQNSRLSGELFANRLPTIIPGLNHRYDEFPLTEIQQAYWVGRSNEYILGNVGAYGYTEYELSHLDIELFETALNKIIKRHEALRIVITQSGNQKILKEVPYYKVKSIDLRNSGDEAIRQELLKLRNKMSHQILPLDQWPLFDIVVTILPNCFVLHFGFDSINIDAFSFQIIIMEWTKLYFNPQLTLKPLDLSFRDYLISLQSIKNSEIYRQNKDYWIKRLNSFPLAPQITTIKMIGEITSPKFTRVSHRMSGNEWKIMLEKLKTHQLTPASFLAYLFTEILARWGKSKHFSINLTLFNRFPIHPEINQIAGDFTSIILLECNNKITENDQTCTLLSRAKKIQDQLWTDLENRLFSGVDFQREFNRLYNSYDYAPLASFVFTCVLGHQLDKSSAITMLSKLQPRHVYTITQTPQVWLDFKIYEEDGELCIEWDYVEDLFPPDMIAEMHQTYCRLLMSLAQNDELWTQTSLDILPEYQRMRNLNTNSTEFQVQPCTLHELFYRRAKRDPNHLAICTSNESMTYDQLQICASNLGHLLMKKGAKSNSLIAIVMDKSIHQVIACLGILTSGAAYLPIDPTLPLFRIQEILIEGNATCILTQEKFVKDLMSINELAFQEMIIPLDRIMEELKSQPLIPIYNYNENSLAYVIFTSGSTGKPKGVMIDHRSVVNTILDINERFGVSSQDKILALSNLSFDLSVYDIFGLLAAGGTIVISSSDELKEPSAWLTYIKKFKITIWNSVPALAKLLMDEISFAHQFEHYSLRLILLSGDKIPIDLPTQIKQKLNQSEKKLEIISLGGATEASIWSVIYPIEQMDFNFQTIPYGKPLRNQMLYILNEDLEDCPDWAIGELHIGGIGLARGYWNRSDLTQNQFILHEKYGRIYKTGDLARYLPDGNVELVGRNDQQIKLGGNRVELGEIESVLNNHLKVSQSIVKVYENKGGYKTLIGYVINKNTLLSDDETNANLKLELQEYLKNRLPNFMIPGQIIFMQSFPLSPNGKIDKQLLPVPELSERHLDTQYSPPQTALEKKLSQIWKDLLHLEKIGIYDDFFKLGGNSLLAMQILSQVRQHEGTELSLKTLFEKPTIAGIAFEIEKSKKVSQSQNLVKSLVPLDRHGTLLDLSFSQKRFWFLELITPKNSGAYNIPIAIRLRGNLNESALRMAFLTLIRRHEILRTTIQSVNQKGEAYQIIQREVNFDIQKVSFKNYERKNAKTEVKKYCQAEATRSFDLNEGPLIRVHLCEIDENEHVLLIVLHHIVADGWSLGIINRELSILYNAYHSEQIPRLHELKMQYIDFVYWQKNEFQKEYLEQQIHYWRKQLKNIPELLSLPYKKVRPHQLSYLGSNHTHILSEEQTRNLISLSQSLGITLFMTLLAVFQISLHRLSGQNDIIVGIPVAGRHYPDTEELVGLFINTLVMRTDFSTNPTFVQVLELVRDAVLAGYSHQDLPFEQLVEFLQINRDISRHPVFQVMFMLQESSLSDLNLMDLNAESFPIANTTSRFDLTLIAKLLNNRIHLCFEYSSDLFEEKFMDQFGDFFHRVVSSIIGNLQHRVGDIPIIDFSEYSQITSRWISNKSFDPMNQTIHKLFEQKAEEVPDLIAIIFNNEHITYHELNARVNQLANYLKKYEIKAESLIAVCVERSLDLIISLLAVLKSNAAYVPLDPEYPSARLGHILEDSQASILITQKHHSEKFISYKGNLICLDEDSKTIQKESKSNPCYLYNTSHLMNVIFTSGSTGKPKGVMIEHRSVINLWNSLQDFFINHEYLAAVTTITFDIAALEIFFPLLSGKSIYLLDREIIRNGVLLKLFLEKTNVSIMQGTPSLWETLTEANWQAPYQFTVLCGGEQLSESLAKTLLKTCNNVWNLYGPTETTIWSCIGKVVEPTNIGVNYPVNCTQVYLVDQYLNLVPPGIEGEICISGEGLARGYLNNITLTQEKFILNKFEPHKKGYLYRTGDIGQMNVEGHIHIIGRKDGQVKYRGFRIELGEIELTIEAHPRIKKCVVLVRHPNQPHQQLVAYFQGGEINVQELRVYLQQLLPAFMIPSEFIKLDDIPYTDNFKIDKKKLLLLSADTDNNASIPTNPIEFTLIEILQKILNISNICLSSNFFEVGGNSLLALKLAQSINKELNIDFSVIDVFKYPVLQDMANFILRADIGANILETLIPIKIDSNNKLLFLVHPAAGLSVMYFKLTPYFRDISVFGINNPHFWSFDQVFSTIEEAASFYVKQIIPKLENKDCYISGWSSGGNIAFEIANQLYHLGYETKKVILIDSFNIAGRQEIQNQKIIHLDDELKRQGYDPDGYLGRLIRKELENTQKLMYHYNPSVYSGKVVLIRAKDNNTCDYLPRLGDDNAWSPLASNLEIHTVNGTHHHLFDSDYIEQLAYKLNECIDTAYVDVT